MSNYNPNYPNFIPISPNVPAFVPPFSQAPDIANELCKTIELRDTAYRAYKKALMAGQSYSVDGMDLRRYQIDKLRTEYIFWRDEVDQIVRRGNTSTMIYKRIIPFDR